MSELQLLTYSPAPPARPATPQGESPASINLPRPATDGGAPLMTALALRMSSREFAATPLPPMTLGALLWAADGINRPASGGRTAPSRMRSTKSTSPSRCPAASTATMRRRIGWC